MATTTTNHLLLNDGGGVWAESIGGPFPRTDPYNSFAGAFADMDSDGDPDVLVVSASPGSRSGIRCACCRRSSASTRTTRSASSN